MNIFGNIERLAGKGGNVEVAQPNRAQRRAQDRAWAAQRRRGQRAYQRQLDAATRAEPQR